MLWIPFNTHQDHTSTSKLSREESLPPPNDNWPTMDNSDCILQKVPSRGFQSTPLNRCSQPQGGLNLTQQDLTTLR